MILKEAFRYQNYLSELFIQAIYLLQNEDFIMTVTQVHARTKVNPEAADEKIELPVAGNVDYTPNKVIDLLTKIIDERQKLSDAISVAKKKMDIDVDSAISMNKMKQNYMSVLSKMSHLKASETEKEGTSYKFNNDGDQVLYRYPLTEIKTINYDRNLVKTLLKKYKKETDTVSMQKDKVDIMTEVYYEPVWDVDTPLEDILNPE